MAKKLVSSTQSLREHAICGSLEIKRRLRALRRVHVYAALLPVWSTQTFEVVYNRFVRVPNRWDTVLDNAGWPMRLDTHGYLNWGGRRPKTLVVQVQCATNVNKQRVPVAYAVDTYETLHNPACNMQLLASRGFTTCLGWNKLVDTHSDSLNAFGENTLEPTSNPLLLPPPKRWLVVGL